MNAVSSKSLPQRLDIALGERSYPIFIGAGLIDDGELLATHIPAKQLLIVSNTTIAPLYLARLEAALGRRASVRTVILPDGEEHKTLLSVSSILDALVGARMNRDATVIALGGGVVGDMAGFAAACYQRGIDFVQVPTTLLAQVDSSVGGKTGVNHAQGKNLIGAFHQPRCVLADTATLDTLPKREYLAGMAEVVKYGLIRDAAFFAWLEAHVADLLARAPAALTHVIRRSCEIKAEVVAIDEREQGLRAILNFGHTFGHAIETATGYGQWLHGEAVAAGMVLAAQMSEQLGWLPNEARQRTEHLLSQLDLPVAAPRVGSGRARELMGMDKKVLDGKVRLVLLRQMGEAIVSSDYSPQVLGDVLQRNFD